MLIPKATKIYVKTLHMLLTRLQNPQN